MTPILSFTRGEFNREVVRLGAVTVGEVSPFTGVDARATYAIWLPELQRSFRPARSMENAREAIQNAVEEWLLRIGVFYPGQGVDIEQREEARAAGMR